MLTDIFFIIAVAVGALIIFAILINYIRNIPIKNAAVTVTLILIGFLLISSPLWANITMKSQNFEVKLLRDISTKQFSNYIKLAEVAEKSLNADAASELRSKIDELEVLLEELKKPSEAKLTKGEIQILKDALGKTEVITQYAVAGPRS